MSATNESFHEEASDLSQSMEDCGIKVVASALRQYLDQVYPADVWTGHGGAPGLRAILLWRNGCDLILRPPTGVSNVPEGAFEAFHVCQNGAGVGFRDDCPACSPDGRKPSAFPPGKERRS